MLLLLLLFFFVVLVLIYKYKSFDKRNIPGLRPQLFYGNLLQTGIVSRKNSLANALQRFQQNYGDVFLFHYFSTPIIVFNTIEHVQDIYRNRHLLDRFDLFHTNATTVLPNSLLSVKNEEWKKHARVVEPLLKRSALTPHLDEIVKCTDALIEQWTLETSSDGLQNDVIDQCQRLLMNIMLSVSYGEENQQRLVETISECNKCSTWSIFNGLHVSLIRLYGNYVNPIYHTARRQLRSLLDCPRSDEAKCETLLQSLIRSSLSAEEAIDEMLLINTGVDGVGTVLSWFIYYMSRYPAVQDKIKLELRQYASSGTNQFIDQLQYIDLVIKEILRHSPVADITVRTIVREDSDPLEIGGIRLRQGDSIGIAVSNLHHDQRYWQIDPSLFYPERFLEDDRDHSTHAYLPFGFGHYRSCPGKYLALYQLKVICVRLMQMVTFLDAGDQGSNSSVRTKGGGFVGLTKLSVFVTQDEKKDVFEN